MRDSEQDDQQAKIITTGKHRWALSTTLFMAAIAFFMSAYMPGRHKRESVELEVHGARQRVQKLERVRTYLENKRNALSSGDPYELEEAIRENLRKGRRGEYVVEDR